MIKSAFSTSLILLFFFFSGQAQDRIITTGHDTLNCKINKITSTKIFYSFRLGTFDTKGKIKRDQVLNFYSGNNSETAIKLQTNNEGELKNLPLLNNSNQTNNLQEHTPIATRLRFGISGGLNFLTGSTSAAESSLTQGGSDKQTVKDYYNKLKLGRSLGANIHYMFNKKYGIGLSYKFFKQNSSMETFFGSDGGVNLIFADFSEKIFVNYGGVSFYSEQFLKSNPKLKWNSHYSAGVAFYRDEATILNNPMLITGSAFATNLDFGIEYFILPRVSAGINLSYFMSSLKKVTFDDGFNSETQDLDKKNSEALSRLDLSVGIHIYR
jgi:hypothetical protein